MVVLENLVGICSSLSQYEIKHIRNSLKFVGHSNNSSLLLFDSVISKGSVSIESLSYIIYKQKNYEALKKLVQRLIDKILDLLISKEVMLESEISDERNLEVFNIKRKLLYYDVLNLRGLTKYALVILDQVIKSCEKFEYYDYLVLALEKKLIKASLGDGSDEYREIFLRIEYFSDCNISLKRAKYLLRLYYTNYNYNQKVLSIGDLKDAVSKVKDDMNRTHSKNIGIQYYYLNGLLLTLLGRVKDCLINFTALNSHLNSNKSMFSNFTFVNCWLNLVECEMKLLNFNSAISYIKLIKSKSNQGEFNNKMILEREYLIYFYLPDIEKCASIMDVLVGNSGYAKLSNFISAKRLFYSAVLYFIQGHFVESCKLLNQCKPLDKDKEGWNLGVRLLFIINYIELGKWTLVESMIENLRKHISRIPKDSIHPRFVVISKVLVALERCSFNFDVAAIKCSKELEGLSGAEKKLIAPLNSPEMILFHEWFNSKLKGIPYNHVEAMIRLKKANKHIN